MLFRSVSHAILRPAVLFGHEDILINNIAWVLRHFPIVPIPGDGQYHLQPIYVEDMADLAVAQDRQEQNTIINAIGPETFMYRSLIGQLGTILGQSRPILSVPSWAAHAMARVAGFFLGDMLITREEIRGLMAGLLAVNSPDRKSTRLNSSH